MDYRNNFMFALPLELKRRVATFLAPKDAINLARSCRTLYSALSLTRLEPVRPLFRTLRKSGAVRTGHHWHRAFRLPVLNRRVHSIQIQFFWRDQGWGNRKTEVRIVGLSDATPIAERPTEFAQYGFGGGRVVASSPDVAPHHEERLRLSFTPMENEYYHLWYKVGEGGGHEMFLREGTLRTVLFDDEFRNFTRNYRILFQEGVLCREVDGESRRQLLNSSLFFPRMLISVSRALRRQLQESGNPRPLQIEELEAFLAEYSIPLNLASLVALEEIVQSDIEERLDQRNHLQAENDDNNGNHASIRIHLNPMGGGPGPFNVMFQQRVIELDHSDDDTVQLMFNQDDDNSEA